MISWKKSAELNKCTIRELKAYFRRHPMGHKKVVVVCDKCGRIAEQRKSDTRSLCMRCVLKGKPSSNRGRRDSEATKKKKSKSHTGKSSGMKDKHHTDDTRERISDTLTGRPSPLKGRPSPLKGKKMTEEQNRKNSEVHKGIPAWNKGIPRSQECCERVSATKQGIPYDEWEDFAKEKNYCPKFTQACRESNREKYGRECFICGKSEKANGQKLSVHHVDMDKAQGCKSNWMLVPLCRSCHSSAHNDKLIARLGFMVKEIDS